MIDDKNLIINTVFFYNFQLYVYIYLYAYNKIKLLKSGGLLSTI